MDSLAGDVRRMVMRRPLDDEGVVVGKALCVRGASRALLLKTDADMCLAVGRALAAVLPCADPLVAGHALTRLFARPAPERTHARTRSISRACARRPGMVGWMAALGFLALVRRCCRNHGVVAGSAALFLERVCLARSDDQVPAWLPNDVDCFFDDPADSRRLLDELCARPGQSRALSVDRAGRRFDIEYDGATWQCGSDYPSAVPKAPGSTVLYGITVDGIALQLIVQRVVPAEPDWDTFTFPPEPEPNVEPCDCQLVPATGCRACMRATGTSGTIYMDGTVCDGYSSIWPPGAPHARFDIDTVCVAVRQPGRPGRPNTLELDRRCGDPFGPMTLRPQAVWDIDADGRAFPRGAPATARLARRVAKYVARGYGPVVVPSEFHLRLDQPVTMAVPTPVREALALPVD